MTMRANPRGRQVRHEAKESAKKLSNQDKYFNAIFLKSTMNVKNKTPTNKILKS